MDSISTTPCPNTVTVRRNPRRKARDTPKYTPQSFNLCEIPPFPNDDVLSAAAETPVVPSTTLQKPENDENLRVFLRIRPPTVASPNQAPRVRAKNVWPQNPTKKSNAAAAAAKTSKKKSSGVCILVNDSQSVTLSPPQDLQDSKRIKSETYGGFSHVFPSNSSQHEVYERMVKPMVEEFLKGKSGMMAALGPSGSGKTHTVFGSPRDPGMVPLALHHIFSEDEPESKQPSRSFYISMFEIYTERGKTEKLFDLLPEGGELTMQQSTIKGLQEVLVSNAKEAESFIALATSKRATAMTKTNSQSSRSQCIINICENPQICKGVNDPKSNSAVLTIIDLAGAEREKRTGNQGTRLLESNFINNTLMVFGLCLRSLLEHQKNPKKPLQKHFQNSMLTRYMRDYLVGKKRMALVLTAKSAEEDYLDTSYLLRQASPYMQIKYNEVEPLNVVTKKRHNQASSAVEYARPSPVLVVEKRKRMKLVQSDERSGEELKISKEDASTLRKLDASSSVSFKSECDTQAQSERSHIIMRNFAKVLWNMLKQYNSKLKAAEKEIQNLGESIGCEKEKYLALETELNEFKASCTCCKRVKGTFYGQEPSEAIFDRSDEEPMVGTSYTRLDAEESDRVSSSKPVEHNALEVEAVDKITSESSKPRFDQSDEEPTRRSSCTQLDFEKPDREVVISSSEPRQHNSLEVDAVDNIPSETFCVPESSISRLEHSDEEPTLGTSCTQSDSEKSDREVRTPLSKLGHHNTVEVEAACKTPSETCHAQESSEPTIDELDGEPTLSTSCTLLIPKRSDREAQASTSGPEHQNASEAAIKIQSGLLVSSSVNKDEVTDTSSLKDGAHATCDPVGDSRGDIRENSSCKPPKPKRTLMPSSSMLSRNFAFDLVDESEKSKGTRKLGAGDQKRSNGSITLLRLLQGTKI